MAVTFAHGLVIRESRVLCVEPFMVCQRMRVCIRSACASSSLGRYESREMYSNVSGGRGPAVALCGPLLARIVLSYDFERSYGGFFCASA